VEKQGEVWRISSYWCIPSFHRLATFFMTFFNQIM
jgi:hypothetical protein